MLLQWNAIYPPSTRQKLMKQEFSMFLKDVPILPTTPKHLRGEEPLQREGGTFSNDISTRVISTGNQLRIGGIEIKKKYQILLKEASTETRLLKKTMFLRNQAR